MVHDDNRLLRGIPPGPRVCCVVEKITYIRRPGVDVVKNSQLAWLDLVEDGEARQVASRFLESVSPAFIGIDLQAVGRTISTGKLARFGSSVDTFERILVEPGESSVSLHRQALVAALGCVKS